MSSSGFESVVSPTQHSPFSISDILSKEKIGQKRSPTSQYGVSIPLSGAGPSGTSRAPVHSILSQEANQEKCGTAVTPKRPRVSSQSTVRHPKIPLSEAGGVATSAGFGTSSVPLSVTPHKPSGLSQINSSLVSPFNTNLLLALGQRPSPGSEEKEELFGESSLGMLSEVAVAQYHSEVSGAEANSSLEAPVREKMANIKLVSTDCSDLVPHEASKAEARNASLVARKVRKTSTPSILKKDKKRRRVQSASAEESVSLSRLQTTHLDTGFLSPLSNEKSAASKELTFSPSIFLSRPDRTSSSSPGHATHNPAHSPTSSVPIQKSNPAATAPPSSLRFSVSPGSESLSDTDGGNFVTSTPIKAGKENVVRTSEGEETWSPTILLNKRHRQLKETESSTSGESDAVKKPCIRGPHPQRKKSKARTKLSPLLENACSPISKDPSAHHQPSPLTTALATTPTRNMSVGLPRPQQDSSSSATASSSFSVAPPPTSSLPLSSSSHAPVPPLPPTFLGSSLLATMGVANPSLGQKLLTSPNPLAGMGRQFPAVSGLLPFSTTPQLTQAQQSLLLQQPNALTPRLPTPFSYPLVSGTTLPQYTGILPNTAAGLPGYFPLLMAPPTVIPTAPSHVAASYLSYNNPYCSVDAQRAGMNLSRESVGRNNSSASGRALDESRRESKQMKSVPPWFIFSNNRSEKPRSRLTEAINKSLSETPSQTAKLPVEWTKLACGQTNDQKQLTEKARHFMQCRPRQLTFTDDMD